MWRTYSLEVGSGPMAYILEEEEPEGKVPFVTAERRFNDNIKMDIEEIICEDAQFIQLAQDMIQ
jgi:hypothetical protein